MLKVDVWSDYVCPFCYIGKRELENAVKAAGYDGQVEINLKAYQLDSTVLTNDERTSLESLATKFGMSVEQAAQQVQPTVDRAKSVGLDFDFAKMKTVNTFKAHRMAKWAESKGKGTEYGELLLKAHFLDHEKVSDVDVLATIAEQVGLSRDEALQVVEGSEFASDVLQDIEVARQIGVRGVPFFVVNDKYAVSGAQPQAVFEEVLQKVAEESGVKPKLQMLGGDSDVCGDDGCKI